MVVETRPILVVVVTVVSPFSFVVVCDGVDVDVDTPFAVVVAGVGVDVGTTTVVEALVVVLKLIDVVTEF